MHFHWLATDGQFALVRYTDEDQTTVIYDLDAQTEVTRLTEERFSVWNRHPDWLITETAEGVLIRRAADLELVIALNAYGRIRFSPMGHYVANIDYTKVEIYELATGDMIFDYEGEAVQSFEFSPDDRAFLIGLLKSVNVYEIADTTPKTTDYPFGYQGCIGYREPTWFNDQSRILFSSYGTGMIWDYQTGEIDYINGTAILNPQQSQITRLRSNQLSILDADSLAVLYEAESGGTMISWSPDGRWVLTYGYDGFAYLHDIEDGSPVQKMAHYQAFDACGLHLYPPEWSADGSQFAVYEFGSVAMHREGGRGKVRVLTLLPDDPDALSGLPLYDTPNTELDAAPLTYLPHETEVTILAIGDAWQYFIQTDDGQQGWIYEIRLNTKLEVVPTPPANKIWLWALGN